MAIIESAAGNAYVPEADQVGTITKVLDTSASVANSYAYDAFGVAHSASEAFSNPYRFAGKPLDADPDLYHFIARQYLPELGRFASEDSVAGSSLAMQLAWLGSPWALNDAVRRVATRPRVAARLSLVASTARRLPYALRLHSPSRYADPSGLEAHDTGDVVEWCDAILKGKTFGQMHRQTITRAGEEMTQKVEQFNAALEGFADAFATSTGWEFTYVAITYGRVTITCCNDKGRKIRAKLWKICANSPNFGGSRGKGIISSETLNGTDCPGAYTGWFIEVSGGKWFIGAQLNIGIELPTELTNTNEAVGLAGWTLIPVTAKLCHYSHMEGRDRDLGCCKCNKKGKGKEKA